MTSESDNGRTSNQAEYEEFYEKWRGEQKYHLDSLIVASKAPPPSPSSLSELVDRVMAHYAEYYTIKSKWVKTDVLLLLSSPWKSQLENAFVWVGGWPPSTAVHLLYSKSGLQMGTTLSEIANCVNVSDLGGLSSEQLRQIDKLQTSIIKREREITEKVAKLQEGVADMEMVELSHDASELTRADAGRVDSAVRRKEEGFEKILQSADDLRLRTLRDIVGVLSRIQAVHFLIAAAELQLQLHDWGKMKQEREDGNNHPHPV